MASAALSCKRGVDFVHRAGDGDGTIIQGFAIFESWPTLPLRSEARKNNPTCLDAVIVV